MEQSETQLHDVKKLNPVSLKLKPSRLEELEEFYKLTERRETVTVEIVEEDFDIEIEQRDQRDKRDKRDHYDHYDHCDHEQSKDDNYLYLKPAEQTQTCITTENSDDDFFADYQ
jgi:ABC-type Zn2+ transport system substrate-binding protein/surface adhesin